MEFIVNTLIEQLNLLWLWLVPFLPIGIFGAWRWGTWAFRKIAGRRYRPVRLRNLNLTTSIIIPVYNEDPDVFRQSLQSFVGENPHEIIAVIDHSDKHCIPIFEEFAKENPQQRRMIITNKPGKRPALVDGMLAATGDLVALVDSDTLWDPGVLKIVVSPFANPKVGGVGTRQNVLNPQGVAQRVFDMCLDSRYLDEMRFLAACGDALTCISGRTAVYRRDAVFPLLDGLATETFWGKQVISGDDKCLTHLVQKAGWSVRYQENARVYTPAFDMKKFLKQRMRWSRNSWRADLKAIFSGWLWKRPALAFHLVDRTVQPFITLISPIYFLFVLAQQRWWLALFLLGWWTVSRGVKVWPSIRRDPVNLLILPAFIGLSYYFAVMRIYTLFTMNHQGWVTRWSADRMQKAVLWRRYLIDGLSYGATAAVLLLLALFVYSNQPTNLPKAGGVSYQQTGEQLRTITANGSSTQASTVASLWQNSSR